MSHAPTPTTAEQFAALAVEMRSAAEQEKARLALLSVVRALILAALAGLCDTLARMIALHQAGLLPLAAPTRPRATARTFTAPSARATPCESAAWYPRQDSARAPSPARPDRSPTDRTAVRTAVRTAAPPIAPPPVPPPPFAWVHRRAPILAPPRRGPAAHAPRAHIPPHPGFGPIRAPPHAKTAGNAGRPRMPYSFRIRIKLWPSAAPSAPVPPERPWLRASSPG